MHTPIRRRTTRFPSLQLPDDLRRPNTNVELINQPLLMIAGDKADSLYMSEEVFKNASGTANKELFLVKGASHIQTYWQPEYVKEISAKLKDFFGKNL